MKIYVRLLLAISLFLFIAGPVSIYGQTPGTFNFTVTTTSTGGYSPRHLIAIWIENSSAAFIRQK
jgi:hypothetical protein